MKILHIISYFQPMLGYQETYLAQEQIRKGNHVRVITSDRFAPILFENNTSESILGKRIKGNGRFIEEGIDVLRLPISFEILSNVWMIGLEKSILDFKPDAIHVHGVLSINSIRVARLKYKIKATRLIYDDHMTFDAVRSKWVYPLYFIFKIFFSNLILEKSDAIVAVHQETKQFMNIMYGFPLDRINFIPLGCDTSKFQKDEQIRSDLRKENGISEDCTVYCYVGKIVPDKGVDILVNSAIEIMKSKKKIVVICVGARDPIYYESITNTINSSGFKDNFIFIPAVPNKDLYKYYSLSDVGVWPRQCSLTMLEAMACGLPIIISSCSGANERIVENINGLTYREGDVDDLRRAMETFLDRITREKMGINAISFVKDLDWKAISEAFESDCYAKRC